MTKAIFKLTTLALLIICALGLPATGRAQECDRDCATCLTEMAHMFKKRGWVGIEFDYDDDLEAVKVLKVIPNSPAEEAGLRSGDILMALNGIRYSKDNEEALKAAYKDFRPGKTITYTVRRQGRSKDIDIRLGEIPEHVMALWIGKHMLEHHVQPEQVTEKPDS